MAAYPASGRRRTLLTATNSSARLTRRRPQSSRRSAAHSPSLFAAEHLISAHTIDGPADRGHRPMPVAVASRAKREPARAIALARGGSPPVALTVEA
jgi:hypothetical protein